LAGTRFARILAGMRRLITALALAVIAAPAFAQERSPAERQVMVDLAYVLGESHALRQTCAGPGDMFWRSRMEEMLRVEAADQGFATRLTLSFNNGFAAGQAGFPACDAGLKAEAGRIAARGRQLSAKLSGP
jgi:uncharacterized protein (TIGR02301 family)